MNSIAIANLEKLLGGPRDNALLRFSLGNEYLKIGDAAGAIPHLREALSRDPQYSAAWKQLGRALHERGALAEALDAYRQGMRVEEIVQQYPYLKPADVHDALAYAYDHLDEIEAGLAADDEVAVKARLNVSAVS